jgi:hypothetical protein
MQLSYNLLILVNIHVIATTLSNGVDARDIDIATKGYKRPFG